MSGAGNFLSGFADSYRMAKAEEKEGERDDLFRKSLDLRRDELKAGNSQRRSLPHYGSGGYEGGTSYSDGDTGGGSAPVSAGRAVKVNDPAATDLPSYARAFLNAVSARESGGAYNVRFTPKGAATFEENGQHPRIYEKGPHGPSSAAGRYQFTASTWDEMGGGEFSRTAQDHNAWKLAQQRYKAYTGGDLAGELQGGGLNSGILTALAPTWAAFGSKGNHGDIIATYKDSYGRYSQAAPAPAVQPARQPTSQQAAPVRRTIQTSQPTPKWAWGMELSMGEPA